jgi:hypothetical protein
VELRHSRYFCGGGRDGNVSRAALKLHVSQPALSRQIRHLEDELGMQLFERTGKAVNLTDAGRLFLKEACTVLERTDEAVRKTLRLTLRSLRETKLILRFRSLQRIHHRIRIFFIHRWQREIIFLKQPNRFQISRAHFCFNRLQFHLFKSKLNDPRNYFLHDSLAMIFGKQLEADFCRRILS